MILSEPEFDPPAGPVAEAETVAESQDAPCEQDASTDAPPSRIRAILLWPFRHPGLTLRSLALGAASVQPAAWLLSRYFWTADLFCHFRELGLAATLVAFFLVVLVKGRVRSIVLAAVALAQLQGFLGYDGPNPVPPGTSTGKPLKVLMANVLYDNNMLGDVADLIEREKPDIVGLVEYSPRCIPALSEVSRQFPYRIDYPAGASGLALWFREPPLWAEPPRRLVAERNPVLHAIVRLAGKPRHFWLVHPTSPLWRKFEPGNPEITALGEAVAAVAAVKGSQLVVGDMNTTDASAHFRDFLATTSLRDSRHGFGRQPSWPTMFPYRIAIDHAFLSDDLAVVSRRLGPMIGSDHFPLILEVAPAATGAAASVDTTASAQPSQSTSTPR